MKIVSIAVSKKKGTRKAQIDQASLIQNHGLEGDAHAGPWHRQVSFLALDKPGRLGDCKNYTDWQGMSQEMCHLLSFRGLHHASGGDLWPCP